ncbi:efflux RND transporter periplasmic adaptor subunit [uncultured Aquimarina sp.]|uniref:efflux RND transporter periplasmic adaptor subunit n=1 Tax=uncultured Aquimarina sp. TaxID=575652 RepID=UPI0026087AC5|nr:efflux RND transporter periplasmic adaptor subunit [uncultured Aquimarina sp.]
MKQLIKIFSLLVIVGLQSSCSEDKKQEPRKPKLVKYQQIGLSNNPSNTSYSGIAQKNLVIDLSFRSNGSITKFNIQLGQKVKKGELLATLDNVSSRLTYEQAITRQNASKSNVTTAKSALERARILYEKGSASLSNFEQTKNAFRSAKEDYESSKRAVSIQRDQIKYGHIYAPYDGIIAAVYSEINENVAPGQSIATLNAGDTMEIELGVPESNINNIAKGDKAIIKFSAIPDTSFSGTVTEVAPALSIESATYPVHITLDDITESIKSGMAATVSFSESKTKMLQKKLVIPAQAVGEDYDGKYVFLIVENDSMMIAKKHPVTIGILTRNGFEIKEGIKSGDRVAVAGLQTLLDGQKIRLQ